MRVGRRALSIGTRKTKNRKRRALAWASAGARRPGLAPPRHRAAPVETAALVQSRAEAEAAVAEARKAHERLREAIDLLPQGIVFLDSEGRYVLWNKQYAEIYSKSADLFKEGARLEETLRIGVARGDYPEAGGREEDWIAERLS